MRIALVRKRVRKRERGQCVKESKKLWKKIWDLKVAKAASQFFLIFLELNITIIRISA